MKKLIKYILISLITITMVVPITGIYAVESENYGAHDIPHTTQSTYTSSSNKSRLSRASIPTSYNSVDSGYVTSVKNQGSNGNCWAYTAVANAETSAIKNINGYSNNIDMSERHLTYFTYHHEDNGLGLTTGDTTYSIGSTYLQAGGNNYITQYELANWVGVANSSTVPDNVSNANYPVESSKAYEDELVLKSAKKFNYDPTSVTFSYDKECIKNELMSNGAIACHVRYSSNNIKEGTYKGNTYHFAYSNISGINHAVTIVGYDDNVPGELFGDDNIGDGAWIVKNSHGSDSEINDDGYYYLSYEDKSLDYIESYQMQSKDGLDNNYSYSSGISIEDYEISSGQSIANIYTINNTNEIIKQIGFALESTKINYSIQLYQNSSNSNPSDGVKLLSTPITGSTEEAGYYYIDVPEEYTVSKGDKISVVITLTSTNGDDILIPYDTTTNYSWIGSTVDTDPNECYFSINDSYRDMNTDNWANRINMITQNTDNSVDITGVSLDKNNLTLSTKGETQTLTASITPTNTTKSKNVKYTSSNPDVCSVDSSGKITALSNGTVTITVTTTNGKTATCTVNVVIPTITYSSHIQNFGWQSYVNAGSTSGTTGKGLRMEAFKIKLSGVTEENPITYSAYIQNKGWQGTKNNDNQAGTTGQSLRVEAIKIDICDSLKEKYDIYYRVHAQSYGWLDWAKNGEVAGTMGYSYRLEAMQVILVAKDDTPPSNTTTTYHEPGVTYKTHIQSVGWQSSVNDGVLSGTTGKGLRLEAITINCPKIYGDSSLSGNIKYRVHIQNTGWNQGWKSAGQTAGATGKGLRLEAIEIVLTGQMAEKYDVEYCVHIQNTGWKQGWKSNGETAGTTGQGLRIEAIKIKLVKK
ncbi:MAG: lectin like domain-containing protein [Thomasclavelia sp.]|jgi:uncharacterized protein YjdB|nr:lectin like domain-containing protein [Thomasclavelia sp.]